MNLESVQPYSWLSQACEALEHAQANAPLINEMVGPLVLQARPFSLPPYIMSDPPYKGYLFESDSAVSTLEEYHQPFPVIALQFPILDLDEDKRMPAVAIVHHNEEKQQLIIAMATKLPGKTDWSWAPTGLNVKITKPVQLNGFHITPISFTGRPVSKESTQTLLNALNPALMATYELAVLLQCQNISIEMIKAPKKVNEKREKNGKRPLPDGYVIRVTQDITRKEYPKDNDEINDDERTSPRTHFRRGHIRRLQAGGTIWVSPTIVNPGNKPINSRYQILI